MKLVELFEAESGIKDQFETLKADESEWGKRLKSWLFGKESAFDRVGEHRNWMRNVPKDVPRDVKLKYPDLIFAIQALALHMGMERYFKEWEKAKKYLQFQPKYRDQNLYRVWKVSEEEIEKLRKGESLPRKVENENSSYTRHSKLWVDDKSFQTSMGPGKRLAVATEYLLQTQGRGTAVMTKHRLTPVFDIFYYLVHLINRAKRVFGVEPSALAGLEGKYLSEREVIAPAVDEIRPEDIAGVYRDGQFSHLHEKEIEVLGRKFSQETIDDMKKSLKKHGMIDQTMFSNSRVITSDLDKSHLKRYATKMIHSPELSDAIGVKMYAGIWP